MIEEKITLIKNAEKDLARAKTIVENNSELFKECKEYYNLWLQGKEGRTANLYIAQIFAGVNLILYLAKTDSMKDFNLFLDEIPYDVITAKEYEEGKWIMYTFDTKSAAKLYVFCMYDNSEHCKFVETGEFKPVYKRVCT